MRKCIDSESPSGRGCAHQGQAGSIAPDIIFRIVKKAYEKGESLVVAPYPVSASFFSNIGFRLVEKGPEMALDREELTKVLSEMEGMIGGEKDLTAWDILHDYVEELGSRGAVLLWPTEGLNEMIQSVEAEEGGSGE